MKKLGIVFCFVLMFASNLIAQTYRTVTVRSIQQVSIDSLIKCDQWQNSASGRWLAQTSPLFKTTAALRETVEVVCQVVVPPRMIMYSTKGFPILVRDTANIPNGEWSGLLCFPSSGDTTALKNAGYIGIQAGDIIRMRGYVNEFPSSSINSATQFVPIGAGFQLIDNRPLPPLLSKQVKDFYSGLFTGIINFSTGEPFEGTYVCLTNLTVSGYVNQTNGTFAMVDAEGNEISTLDVSKWFTTRAHKDPASTYTLPPLNAQIDTIKGYITTNSGGESVRGYRICPVFLGDIKIGKIFPGITTHRRNPVVITPNDSAKISVKAYVQSGVNQLKTVLFKKSIDNGPFTTDTMKASGLPDSIYNIAIGYQPANTFIKYFVQAIDTGGNVSTYANAASSSVSRDTSRGCFYFTVKDTTTGPKLTILDIQSTPFSNGISGLLGAVISVSGIVTADTASLTVSQYGAIPWYIQSANSTWSGIWVNGPDATMAKIHRGDSVTVTGTVQEWSEVTRLGNVTSAVIHSSGNTEPEAVVVPTGNFIAGVASGNLLAEPYEGMVVQFNNVAVTNINPTYNDPNEYTVNDGSGDVIVRCDGKNSYSNNLADTVAGKTIIKLNDRFSYIRGIMFFGNRQYRFVPRTQSDFGTLTSVSSQSSSVPFAFQLSQNYPNPFNPITRIDYSIPQNGIVSLKVYNILGQEVQTLMNRYQTAGQYTVWFDGASLPSGVYFYRLQSNSAVQTHKMVLLK